MPNQIDLKPEAIRLFAALQPGHLDACHELTGLAILQFVRRPEEGDVIRLGTITGEVPAELISFVHGFEPGGDATEFDSMVEQHRAESA